MYCRKCGAEIGDAKYCPICGAKQEADGASQQSSFQDEAQQRASKYETAIQPSQGQSYGYDSQAFYSSQEASSGSWLVEKLLAIFRDPMFLTLTILMTVSAALGSVGFSAANGKMHLSLGILSILFVVGLWLIYGAAKKDDSSFISGLSFTSGVVKAYKIIMWVAIVALLVGAILCFIAGPTLLKSFSWGGIDWHLVDDIPSDVIDEIPDIINHDKFGYFSNFMLIGIGIALIVADVVLLIVNLCFIKKLHRFTKSLCDSVKSNVYDVKDAVPSKNWLIVSAVFGILGAVGGGASSSVTEVFGITISTGNAVLNSVSAACSAAAAIIASILIKRNFTEQ